MRKKLHLLAVWNSKTDTSLHKKFFEKLADSFSDICHIELIEASQIVPDKVLLRNNYVGLLAFSPLKVDLPSLLFSNQPINDNENIYISNISEAFTNPESILLISNKLFLFVNKLQKNSFNYLPFNFSVYDANDRLDYSNDKTDNEFSIESQPKEKIEDWIVEEVKNSPSHSFTLTIPTMSSEKILIQHFQGLYDKNQRYHGVLQNVFDLKPILENYLNETGQAIVPWSDVTSGASIKNDNFDL
ncbi:hypothetical protein [Streptococcus zalophi]|uniref:Uncharacterized protein n=1 Tax=Streptococcus zalophi TaxID=640031 RepID=A0A934UD49_9STRE|nr:hypothetical protein [Streptococcus zalophi]MBJ8349426.1 hypothetical protein [Streptococcus zalophi]